MSITINTTNRNCVICGINIVESSRVKTCSLAPCKAEAKLKKNQEKNQKKKLTRKLIAEAKSSAQEANSADSVHTDDSNITHEKIFGTIDLPGSFEEACNYLHHYKEDVTFAQYVIKNSSKKTNRIRFVCQCSGESTGLVAQKLKDIKEDNLMPHINLLMKQKKILRNPKRKGARLMESKRIGCKRAAEIIRLVFLCIAITFYILERWPRKTSHSA